VDDSLLTTKEAAKFLGMSEAFLERDRWEGNRAQGGAGCRVPFVRVGKRAVRYNRRDLEAYVHSQIRSATNQPQAATKPKRRTKSLVSEVARQALSGTSQVGSVVAEIGKVLPKVIPDDAIESITSELNSIADKVSGAFRPDPSNK
jgi:hypothetical protein